MRNAALAAIFAALLPTQLSDASRVATPVQFGGPFGSFQCGIAPIPPLGCRVGACVCDQSGRNCQWQMVCN